MPLPSDCTQAILRAAGLLGPSAGSRVAPWRSGRPVLPGVSESDMLVESMAVDLEEALRQFDRSEANLAKLEKLLAAMEEATPSGISFGAGGETIPGSIAHDTARRGFQNILRELPAIDGWRLEDATLDLDDLAQMRLDALEIGEIGAQVSVLRAENAQGEQLREYRFRFARKRSALVRTRLVDLFAQVDATLAALLNARVGVALDANVSVDGPDWDVLRDQVDQLDKLLGSTVPRGKHWANLRRHLRFAAGCDLRDIAEEDWPLLKREVDKALYDDFEPVPVETDDLGLLAVTSAGGPVPTALPWARLTAESFERLVWAILLEAPGYENVEWLMKTNAPDRGRDISADRVLEDVICGARRERVIVQCKHWQSKSIPVPEIAALLAQVTLWEPPRVDIVVIATSGRFTSDAVAYVEKRREERRVPALEMWPGSRFEQFLAARPATAAEFGLR